MPATCAAIGCSNNKALKRRLTFYYFPKKTSRRQEWAAAMKRKNWSPTDHSRLCSEHFISGMKSNNPLSPDYIPSLFVFLTPEQRQQKITSYIEFQQAQMKEGNYNSLWLPTLGDDTEDDTDSSDGVQADEGESRAVKQEEATATTSSTADKTDDAFNDGDTVKGTLKVEPGEVEDCGRCARLNKTTVKRIKRYDRRCALGRLTRKFATIIGCPNKVFDLNVISERLGVPKRRLYDITNVLQGVRLLEKASKNLMQWSGPPVNQCLRSEIQTLTEQEKKLDELIEGCKLHMHRLCEDAHIHGKAYLTYDDLQTIPILSDQAVIVISAPSETKLEVSHPYESFRIHLRSRQGPIDVLMCHTDPVPTEGQS